MASTGPTDSVLLTSCAIVHAAHANRSARRRPMVLAGYASADTVSYAGVPYKSRYRWRIVEGEGHLFITVIAYQLVQVIRQRLCESGEDASWVTLRRVLEGEQRVTATFRREDGRTLHVRKATRAEAPQQVIYDALGVASAPGGIRESIV